MRYVVCFEWSEDWKGISTVNVHYTHTLFVAQTEVCTSIQAAWVPLAGRALEQRSWSVNQRARLSGLSLSATTVAKLRAQCQELPWSGGHLSRGQSDQKKNIDTDLVIWPWVSPPCIYNKIATTLSFGKLTQENNINIWPEEGVMFYTHFPQLLGSFVIW